MSTSKFRLDRSVIVRGICMSMNVSFLSMAWLWKLCSLLWTESLNELVHAIARVVLIRLNCLQVLHDNK